MDEAASLPLTKRSATRIARPLRLVFFASGGPGNIATAFELESTRPDLIRIEAVVCDREATPAAALAREKQRRVIERDFDAECGFLLPARSNKADSDAYRRRSTSFHDQILLSLERIEGTSHFCFDIAVLAYRRLIHGALLERFKDAAINQHPADLSVLDSTGCRKYVGIGGLGRALRDGVSHTRTSTILINEGVDTGEIICQGPALPVPQRPIDAAFISEHEHRQKSHSDWPSLTFALTALAEGRVSLSDARHTDGTRVVLLDNRSLPYSGARIASFAPEAAEPFVLEQPVPTDLPAVSVGATSPLAHDADVDDLAIPSGFPSKLLPAGFTSRVNTGEVDNIPIEFHCHGIGPYDFSNLDFCNIEADLDRIDSLAGAQQIDLVPTLFLAPDDLESLETLAACWSSGRAHGRYRHIPGFALEGPVLSRRGGTPEHTSWLPTRAQWQRIVALGSSGLIYSVISVGGARMLGTVSQDWVLDAMLQNGVTPALGHFPRDDIEGTVQAIDRAVGLAERYQRRLLTDHLLNDMPKSFRHAWRTPQERLRRPDELRMLQLSNWTLETLDQCAGRVPAALMRHAHAGRITTCLNFDGEHVDISVARRIVDLVGENNIIAMTDRVDGRSLAGTPLLERPTLSLRFNESGIVSAGSQSIFQLMQNMRGAGLSETAIVTMTHRTARHFLPHVNACEPS